jgi:hypothetical protein
MVLDSFPELRYLLVLQKKCDICRLGPKLQKYAASDVQEVKLQGLTRFLAKIRPKLWSQDGGNGSLEASESNSTYRADNIDKTVTCSLLS